MLDAALLSIALDDGAIVDTFLGRLRVERRQLGLLKVTSGRIVACDAQMTYVAQPYLGTVRCGSHPVWASIVHLDDGDQRITLAGVHFRSGVPSRWRTASARPCEEPTTEEESEALGYAVESGNGCFFDADALPLLVDKDPLTFCDQLWAAMKPTYVHTREWTDLLLDEQRSLNMIAFSTGMGDGTYCSYWGFDDTDRLLCLVTDFGLLDPPLT
jgi:hypothetical protein